MPFFKPNDVFAGRYQLVELMGEGDFSEVWAAEDQWVDDEMVVLKMYAPGKGMDGFGIHQYRREYLISQNISHPHLLKISHLDISEGIAYQVLPFYPLGTLSRLKEEGSFSERQVALVMSQIGSALALLHRQEPPVLHQHVQPENIVISAPDHFLLANFGISSLPTKLLSDATAGQNSVTIAYAPPETFEKFLMTNQSVDIFSLGVVLFEMCTKKLPWNGGGGQTFLEEPYNTYFGQLPKQYSSELNELLHACMSLNSFKRPSADELQLRANNFLKTGQWNLPIKEEQVSLSKRAKPYLLVAAISAFLLIGTYLSFTGSNLADPIEKETQMGTSLQKDNQSEEDERVTAMLENKLEHLAQRNLELEEENKKLMYKDSVNKILLEKHSSDAEIKVKPVIGKKVKVVNHEKTKRTVLTPVPTAKNDKADDSLLFLKELEQQLNKISDPELPEEDRIFLKQQTLADFSEGAVRILDITAGTQRQYAAGIFLNLLYNVPHTILVKEVKRDQNKKITEIRLGMQAKN